LVQDGTEPVLYVNGSAPGQSFSTSTDKTDWFSTLTGLDVARIACLNYNSGGNTSHFAGALSDVLYYSRPLGANEVLNRYNATKAQFGGDAPSRAPNRDGVVDKALPLDGVSEYVEIPGVLTTVASDTAGAWSFMLEVGDSNPAADSYILGLGDANADERLYLKITATTGILEAGVTDGGTVQWVLETDAAPFTSGTWYSIVLTHDGTSPTIYIDGVEVAQTATTSTDLTAWMSGLTGLDTGNLGAISYDGGGITGYLLGTFQDVRVWSSALTAGDATKLFQEVWAINDELQTFADTRQGVVDEALAYDGVREFTNIDSVLRRVASDTAGTVTFWCTPDDGQPASAETLIGFGDANANELLELQITTAGLLLAQCIDAGTTQWVIDTDAAVWTDGAQTVAKHIALVQDGTEAAIYVDGAVVATTASTSTDLAVWFSGLAGLDTGRLSALKYNNAAEANFYAGDLADVRIYSRALSAAEILQLSKFGPGYNVRQPTWATGRNSKANNAVALDGLEDHVKFNDLLQTLGDDTAGSWGVWVKPDDGRPAAEDVLFGFGDTNADEHLYMAITTAGLLLASCKDAGTLQWVIDTDAAVWADGAASSFTHVLLTHDGTTAVLYVDGLAVAQAFSTSTNLAAFLSALTGLDTGRLGDLNANSAGEASHFAGDAQDLFVYDVALTAQEAWQLYNA